MMSVFGWAFLAAAAVTPPAHRVYEGWESALIGGGGYLQQMAIAPSNPSRIYLGTDVGGCYRSDDAGRTWRMLHGALPSTGGVGYQAAYVAVSPRDPDRVLVACGNGWAKESGVYLSTDAGASFRLVLAAPFWGNGENRNRGPLLVPSPRAPETVYAMTPHCGLFRSDDFGATWRSLGLERLVPRALVIDRTEARRLWVVAAPCAPGLFTTAPGAAYAIHRGVEAGAAIVWEKVAEGAAPLEFVQDPFDPDLLHGAFAVREAPPPLKWSRDGGRTWHEPENAVIFPKPGDPFHDGRCQALTTGPDFVLAACTGGAFYRADGGTTRWTKVPVARVDVGDWYLKKRANFRYFGAAAGWVGLAPNDPRIWYMTDWYGAYVSRDAGATWRLAIDGIEMTVVHCVAQVPGDARRVFCGMADVGALRSEDGGHSFTTYLTPALHDNVKGFAVCALDARRVYALGPEGWGWQSSQLSVSRDGGDTWRRPAMAGLPSRAGDAGARMSTVAVHPLNPDEVVLVVSGLCGPKGGGVYRSRDAGETFTWIGEGLPTEALFHADIWGGGAEVACSREGALIAASDLLRRAWRLPAGATQWQEVQISQGEPKGVVSDANVEGRFYLVVGGAVRGLYRSDDAGASWRCVRAGEVSAAATDLDRAGRVACADAEGLAWSDDAGATWRRLSGRPPRAGGRLCFAGDSLIVGTGGSGVFRHALQTP